jgi:hypothetical protein
MSAGWVELLARPNIRKHRVGSRKRSTQPTKAALIYFLARVRVHPRIKSGGMIRRDTRYRNRLGHSMVRHMCADGLLSRPRPSFGCLKLRPMMSVKSSRLTLALGSNE